MSNQTSSKDVNLDVVLNKFDFNFIYYLKPVRHYNLHNQLHFHEKNSIKDLICIT